MPGLMMYVTDEIFALLSEAAKRNGVTPTRYAASVISAAMLKGGMEYDAKVLATLAQAGRPLDAALLADLAMLPRPIVIATLVRLEQAGKVSLDFANGLPSYTLPRAARPAPIPQKSTRPADLPEDEHWCDDLECGVCFAPDGTRL